MKQYNKDWSEFFDLNILDTANAEFKEFKDEFDIGSPVHYVWY